MFRNAADRATLKRSLDDTVVSAVNRVGVEVNTASKQLLSYVSGLNATTAAAIVARRNEKGAFASRADLKEVPRLGPRAVALDPHPGELGDVVDVDERVGTGETELHHRQQAVAARDHARFALDRRHAADSPPHWLALGRRQLLASGVAGAGGAFLFRTHPLAGTR